MKRMICFLLLLPLFAVTAYAETYDELDVSAVEDALPDAAREISGNLTIDTEYDSSGALQRLWTSFCSRAKEELADQNKEILRLSAITVLVSIAAAVCPEKKTTAYIHMASCAAVSLMLADGVDGMITQAVSAIDQLSDYSKAALPAVFTAAAASGAAVSAPAQYGAACLALDVIMSLSKKGTIPLIYAFMALAVSSSLFDHPLLSGMIKLLKKLIILLMTVTTTAFTAYIGITGIVTASTDATAVKTTKTVISAAFPVVGGILSDAAGAVLSAASVIRNTAGAFSLVAVCALSLGPFIVLSVKWLLFRLAAALSDMIPGGRIAYLLEQMSTLMGMLLGMVGSYGMMLFFSITSAIRAVTV